MTRLPSWLLVALASVLPLALAATSSSASLFLHPCNEGVSKPAKVSPSQANRVLAYHLDVPGEYLGAAAGDKEAWEWVPQTAKLGKESVKDLFEDNRQRTVVLLKGVEEGELQDVIPLSFRNTHKIDSPPSTASFEALIHSYGERLHEAIPSLGSAFGGFFLAAVEEAQSILEDATEMLVGGSAMSVPLEKTDSAGWKKSLDVMDLTGKASTAFRQSMVNLVAFFDSFDDDKVREQQPSFQALRFDGLAEIRSTYGQESVEYKEAKKALKDVLAAAAMKMDKLASSSSQTLAIVAVSDDEDEKSMLQPRSDLLAPFRTGPGRTPFQKRRDASIWDQLETNKKGSKGKAPKESDYVGKCFSKEEDLNKATQNCTGHGKPKKSLKGGKPCYRCQCETTRSKSGKTVEWAGAACQKQDISKPFVLLASSTVVLILVSIGSVLYLYNEGQKELPSVLAGISIPNK